MATKIRSGEQPLAYANVITRHVSTYGAESTVVDFSHARPAMTKVEHRPFRGQAFHTFGDSWCDCGCGGAR